MASVWATNASTRNPNSPQICAVCADLIFQDWQYKKNHFQRYRGSHLRVCVRARKHMKPNRVLHSCVAFAIHPSIHPSRNGLFPDDLGHHGGHWHSERSATRTGAYMRVGIPRTAFNSHASTHICIPVHPESHTPRTSSSIYPHIHPSTYTRTTTQLFLARHRCP